MGLLDKVLKKPTPKEPPKKRSCDQWRGGLCGAVSTRKCPVYCPAWRAVAVLPEECCHHPRFKTLMRMLQLFRRK